MTRCGSCLRLVPDARGWPRLEGDSLQSCTASDPMAEIRRFAVCLLPSLPGYSLLLSTALVSRTDVHASVQSSGSGIQVGRARSFLGARLAAMRIAGSPPAAAGVVQEQERAAEGMGRTARLCSPAARI